jgi:glyoxylase-like metal-dependent hydrolase (beta-lactamase superfamily II)
MSVFTIDVGAVRLTRVGYADVDLAPETFGLTAEQVARVPWAEPVWAHAGQVRAAAAAWVVQSDDATIVVDPALAADELLRTKSDAALHQEAFAALLAEARLPRERITHAVATHLDGIGMFAWRNEDGGWTPFFPHAPLLYSQRELDAIDGGSHLDPGIVLAQLRALGAVRPTGDHEQLTAEVWIEQTGAHSPGHQIVRIESQGERAVIVGHLAVVPLHLSTGAPERQHVDATLAGKILDAIREEDALLIGPLWPTPGCGRWDGDQLVPAQSS